MSPSIELKPPPFVSQTPALQVEPETQVPQVTSPPQPLATLPHSRSPQTWEAGRGVQPHTLGVPPPPQLRKPEQALPQVYVPPHPLLTVPQFFPAQAVAWEMGVHPQTLVVPLPPQVCGEVQVPQAYVPPQPLGTVPQFFPAHAVARGMGLQPHTFAVPPPPQVWGLVQVPVPQVYVPPQPSATVPQFFPAQAVSFETEEQVAQTLATPPPPQTCPPWQEPQFSVPPHPSETLPQFFPSDAQVAAQQAFELSPHTSPSQPWEPSSMRPSQSSSRPLQVSGVLALPSPTPSRSSSQSLQGSSRDAVAGWQEPNDPSIRQAWLPPVPQVPQAFRLSGARTQMEPAAEQAMTPEQPLGIVQGAPVSQPLIYLAVTVIITAVAELAPVGRAGLGVHREVRAGLVARAATDAAAHARFARGEALAQLGPFTVRDALTEPL
ncbi:hypothetical protein [Corallococcus exercitus]|uniref:hypothetical protein n=1 Tax=Corallococcus exercitus TaxID=2316736 RepID=UPI0011C415C5|nr:hypothetical protein [Corallococcus exercitus]